jgi:DNA repair protein RadC
MNPLARNFRQAESCGCREAPVVRPRVFTESRPRRRVRDAKFKPVELTTIKGSPCRPFFHIEKDPEAFAACNALADEIGPLNEPKKAFRLIEEAIGDEPYEVFGFVTVDLHCRFKSMGITGRGEAAAVMAPMVPTMQAILMDGSYGALICHCHPSGIEAKPSQADKDTTKAFEKAFEACGVIFIDHIISAGSMKQRSYFSFLEAGLLKK